MKGGIHMLILKSVDRQNNKAVIFDSSTMKINSVSLLAIAGQINKGTVRVYGLRKLSNAQTGCICYNEYNICISKQDAKMALSKMYQEKYNMSKEDADRKVGL
jgi:hypothetical protein